MKIHYNIENFKAKNPVFTIGSFDGVHKGHKKVLSELIQFAIRVNGESVLMIFWPHPREILSPLGKNFKLIQSIKERTNKLSKTGIDHLIIFPFSLELSKLTTCEFVKNILVDKLKIKYFLIGFNQKFGSDRKSKLSEINNCTQNWNIDSFQLGSISVKEKEVSSTRIRDLLFEGKIKDANKLLGYKYNIEGIVVKGNQIGRTIGFPTANIRISDEYKIIPSDGVYAVEGIIENKHYQGMLNIGHRPTLNGQNRTIEIHWFDFDKTIYNQKIKIFFIQKIRNEQKFEGIENLKIQLKKDKKQVQSILQKTNNILVVGNSINNTTTSFQTTNAISLGIKMAGTKAIVQQIPLSILKNNPIKCLKLFLPQLEKIEISAKDALMNDINTYYLADLEQNIAYIDLNNIIGLNQLKLSDQNPLLTTSYGLGQLILDAANKMFQQIVIFSGESSTCDAGLGLLFAMGAKIKGNFPGNIPTGLEMIKVKDIESPPKISAQIFIIEDSKKQSKSRQNICKRNNSQKEINELNNGLQKLIKLYNSKSKKEKVILNFSTKDGGISSALKSFFNAQTISENDLILQLSKLTLLLQNTDLLISTINPNKKNKISHPLLQTILQKASEKDVPIWGISIFSEEPDKVKTINNLQFHNKLYTNKKQYNQLVQNSIELLKEKISNEIPKIINKLVH